GADLPGVRENAAQRAVDRAVQALAVGEHDVRTFTAAFQPYRFHVGIGGIAQQFLADTGGAREADHVDVAVLADGLAGTGTHAGYDVEHTSRQTGLPAQFGQTQCGQWCVFGRLEHNGVARGQGGGDLYGCIVQWEIPGDDGTDHTDRLVGHGGL